MSELLQSGQHPDADQLSAFIEHALPAHELEQTLAHLAICPHCRSIVALSLPAVEESPVPQRHLSARPWLSGWNLVLPAAAALAALILAGIYIRRDLVVPSHTPPDADGTVTSAGAAPRSAGAEVKATATRTCRARKPRRLPAAAVPGPERRWQ